MSRTAVPVVTRSPLIAMASAPASQSSWTSVRMSRAVTRASVVSGGPAGAPPRELRGGLDERRPLLARISDPGAFGGQLRRDQEAQDEERAGQRHLPARQ